MIKKIKILLFLVFCLSGCIPVGWTQPDWGEALTTHNLVLKNNSRLELLWVQTVFTHKFDGRQLVATDGKVFFIGSLSQTGEGGLIALDGENGNELWQVPASSTVEMRPEMVYVSNQSSVIAYTLDGEKLWQTKLPARYVTYIHAINDKLFVETGSFHLLDAISGDLLASSSEQDIFETDLNSSHFWGLPYTPTFVGKRVFYRDEYRGRFFSEVFAFDLDSGNFLWETSKNVISNVAATENLAFVITHEDKLQILNAGTGKILETNQIEPSLDFFNEDLDSERRIYQLAVDQTHQILYVLLGDSNQLFAFKINN